MTILLSPSSRKLAEKCNRKFIFNLLMKYNDVPRQQSGKAALTGNALHSIIEAYRLEYDDPIKYAMDLYPMIPNKSKDQHCWDFIKLTFLAYKQVYPIENENPLLTSEEAGPFLEKHWIDEEPVDNSLFPDQGFIDRIEYIPYINELGIKEPFCKERDKINIIDVKTTKDDVTSKEWFKKWNNDLQPALYIRNMRNEGYIINAFMIDSVQHTRKYRRFKRLELDFDEQKCEKIINSSDFKVQSAMENPTNPNKSNCYEYGACQYLPICQNSWEMTEEEMLSSFYETYNIKEPKDTSLIRYESKF